MFYAEHLSGDATAKLITQAKTAFDIAFVIVLVAGTAIMLLMAAVIAQIINRAKIPEPSRMSHSSICDARTRVMRTSTGAFRAFGPLAVTERRGAKESCAKLCHVNGGEIAVSRDFQSSL